ncbi:MAG: trigger factor [Lachnospiraceae bacterium]|nr:trigger factor [Lachnospiraceae bacterium]
MKMRRAVMLMPVLLALAVLIGCGEEKSKNLADVKVEKYLIWNSEYTGLSLTLAPRTEVTDEMVEQTLVGNLAGYVTSENGIKDRAAELGDTVNIDYSGKKDGVAFEGGTAANQSMTLGAGGFIPGFEDGIVGVKPGETVDLDLSFPEGYGNEELAGQAVVFTITVNYIYPATTDEIPDDVVSWYTNGEYTTMEDFRVYCREYLEYNADYQYNSAKEAAVIQALEAIVECEKAPDTLVEKYAANIRASLERQAAQYGVDVETFCTYYYRTDYESYVAQVAQASARQGMMFQYIANKEGLNVSDEELDESLQNFVEENKLESVEVLLADTDKEEFREYFMFEKVVDFVFDNAQVTEN